MNKFDKIFNPYLFIILNIVIIFFAEFGGEFFYETGLVHLIALLFVVLSLGRIYIHYYPYDSFLEVFFHYCMAALTVFALSHIFEFLSYVIFKLHEDAIFANVANFYIISLLLIVIGAELFLKTFNNKSKALIWGSTITICVVVSLIAFFVFNDNLVSLEIDSPTPYIYTVVGLIIAFIAFRETRRVGYSVPLAKDFSYYFQFGIVMIALAALINVWYDVGAAWNIPDFQMIYLSHFAFYASLSAMFLAFQTTANLNGIYKSIKQV